MKKHPLFSLIFIFLFFLNSISAQSILITGGDVLNQSIAVEELFFVTIQDNRKDKKAFYLQAIVSDQNNKQVFIGKSNRFALPVSGNLKLSPLNIDQYLSPVVYQFIHPTISKSVSLAGEFPQANYQICIKAIDADENTQLANYCYNVTSTNSNIIQLVSPYNHTAVDAEQPVFTWTSGINQAQLYDYVLVEIIGNQSSNEAIRLNKPIYEAKDLPTSVHVLPTHISLQKCKKYAWQIRSEGSNKSVAISEIFTFNSDCDNSVSPNTSHTYAVLRKYLDGGYFIAENRMLKFKFDEAYFQDDNINLNFKIKDIANNEVAIADNKLLDYGDNRYLLDLSNLDLGAFYSLEIIDSKRNRFYLKFKTTN